MNIRKIKPALYRLEDLGLSWAWIYLKELAEIINIPPSTVWENFFALSKDIDLLAISDGMTIWNIGRRGEITLTWDGQEWQYAFGARKKFLYALLIGNIFVPAGWALTVIQACELGAVRIIEQQHEHTDLSAEGFEECPQGTLNCTFNGANFTAAIGSDANNCPVEIVSLRT